MIALFPQHSAVLAFLSSNATAERRQNESHAAPTRPEVR